MLGRCMCTRVHTLPVHVRQLYVHTHTPLVRVRQMYGHTLTHIPVRGRVKSCLYCRLPVPCPFISLETATIPNSGVFVLMLSLLLSLEYKLLLHDFTHVVSYCMHSPAIGLYAEHCWDLTTLINEPLVYSFSFILVSRRQWINTPHLLFYFSEDITQAVCF